MLRYQSSLETARLSFLQLGNHRRKEANDANELEDVAEVDYPQFTLDILVCQPPTDDPVDARDDPR